MNTKISQTSIFHEPNMPDRLFIEIPEEQIDGWTKSIATIDIKRKDGKTARFFVAIRIPGDSRAGKIGQAYCQVTGMRTNTETTKEVSASWVNYDERLNEIIAKNNK